MTTWVDGAAGSGFDVDHLPYGSTVRPDGSAAVAVRIGEYALDVTAALHGTELAVHVASGTLDRFLAAGRPAWRSVRDHLTGLLSDEQHRARLEPLLKPVAEVRLQLPFAVADYVDFYASEFHAANVGRIFRPGGDPLTPNWKHLPIGYHGRAGTIVVSGTEVVRPAGQARAADDSVVFGPSRRLDIEAEVAFVVGRPSTLGVPVALTAFPDYVFGVALLNDWSARDIQAWEYVPLGPFLGKSFATSLAAWITPMDALAHAIVPAPERDPRPLPYLDDGGTGGLDLQLEVRLNGNLISRPPFAAMYWTPPQMLAHLTVNGAGLRTGDLYASGTVSGPDRDGFGSLLELTRNGSEPIGLPDGTERGYLEDGDEVVISATAPGANGRLTLGEVTGRIVARRAD
jgi:fumarylacetoacetase